MGNKKLWEIKIIENRCKLGYIVLCRPEGNYVYPKLSPFYRVVGDFFSLGGFQLRRDNKPIEEMEKPGTYGEAVFEGIDTAKAATKLAIQSWEKNKRESELSCTFDLETGEFY